MCRWETANGKGDQKLGHRYMQMAFECASLKMLKEENREPHA